jgi:hypothetical protein
MSLVDVIPEQVQGSLGKEGLGSIPPSIKHEV